LREPRLESRSPRILSNQWEKGILLRCPFPERIPPRLFAFRIDNISKLALELFHTSLLSPDSVLVAIALLGGKRWNSSYALQTPGSPLSGYWESTDPAKDLDVLV